MAKLTIDTDVPLTAREKAILRILLDESEPAAAPAAEEAEEKKPARKAPAKKAPAKTQKAEKAPVEEVADKEPETDEGDGRDLVAEAVKVARALVRDGDAATVQKGLEAADAARVSEMTGEQAAKFLEAVK